MFGTYFFKCVPLLFLRREDAILIADPVLDVIDTERMCRWCQLLCYQTYVLSSSLYNAEHYTMCYNVHFAKEITLNVNDKSN